jgi:hypothetical protein
LFWSIVKPLIQQAKPKQFENKPMPYFTATFSTANSTTPGNSAAANLNWIGGKPTTVSLSFGGSSTVLNDIKIQYSLDDLQRVGGSSLATWITLSSGIGNNSTAAYHFASTTWFDTGFLAQFLTPIAAVRMVSTTFESTGGLGSATLKVIQGEAW